MHPEDIDAGNALPSIHSRNAPPAVDTQGTGRQRQLIEGRNCIAAAGHRQSFAACVSSAAASAVSVVPLSNGFHFGFSRFGTQFFENPVAGLRNMRKSLKPGGIMTMIVWRSLAENPWLALPKDVILRHLPPPGENARTCGPGPFPMAEPEVVTKQLEIAGYEKASFERVDANVLVGRDLDEAVALQLDLGPAGEVAGETV